MMKQFVLFVSFLLITIEFVCAGNILTVNNQIHCDGLVCPKNTNKCIAIDKTTDDLNSIRNVRECYDIKGKVIKRLDTITSNPYPGNAVNNYSSVSNGNGNVVIQSNVDPKEAKKIIKNAEHQANNAIRLAKEQSDYWANWQRNFQKSFQF